MTARQSRPEEQQEEHESVERLARLASEALGDPGATARERALARGLLAHIAALEHHPAEQALEHAAAEEAREIDRALEEGGSDAVREWFRSVFGVDPGTPGETPGDSGLPRGEVKPR